MEKILKEKTLDNYPLPVTIKNTEKILEQLKKCVCKIKTKNGNGTGFFCNIPYNDKELPVFMTNYHIIDNNFIKENKNITVTLNEDKDIEYKNIEIDINKKIIYMNEKYDITIIEIKKEKENINNFLVLDENIFNENILNENQILCNESIYILQYPKYGNEQKASISYGTFKQIENDGYNIEYYCCTDVGSSGSPILRLSNNKIIGIHKEGLIKFEFNRGGFLKEPINEFLNYIKTKISNKVSLIKTKINNNFNDNILKQKNNNILNQNNNIKNNIQIIEKQNYKNNYIIAEIQIGELDINEDIRIINSYEQCNRENQWYEYKEENENEKEIKENCEIKINNKIILFSYFYRFNKKGKYFIQYSFKKIISNTNCMFYDCNSLININLSNFKTQNVTNMSYKFYNCSSLTNINLSNINTQNTTNISYMFYKCLSLTNINLSNFNTQNVINMSYLFYNCSSLTNINLSNFNTQNATNMSYMFYNCSSLTNINLSNFNTKNVTNMSYMFSYCSSLKIN